MKQPSSESMERKDEAPWTSALAPCAYGMGPNRHTITSPLMWSSSGPKASFFYIKKTRNRASPVARAALEDLPETDLPAAFALRR